MEKEERLQKAEKKKTYAILTAAVLILVGILSGSFAWQSISQNAKNELNGEATNPGGRLHDDFDGKNKDVYVENFGDQKLYVRVRLDEYMELGEGAGTGKNARSLVDGAVFDKVTTWTVHKPGAAIEDCQNGNGKDTFHDFIEWEMGGKTVYMPTFNTNKDSLKADINGTLTGKFGKAYDDYRSYEEGQKETGTEIWDDDANNIEDDNVKKVEKEHTAKVTPEAKVVKMADWDQEPGDVWVVDTDGWAYYAKGIEPGEATGLLLNGITVKNEPAEKWYYAINVIGQFATGGDWGKEDKTGFFADNVEGIEAPSAAAMRLLNRAAGLYDVTVTGAGNVTKVTPGEQLQMEATITLKDDTEIVTSQKIQWEVRPEKGKTTNATIDQSGMLTIPQGEMEQELLVQATVEGTASSGICRIQIKNQ